MVPVAVAGGALRDECVGVGRRGINPTPMGVNVRHGCPMGFGCVLWCAPGIVDGPRYSDCRPIPVGMMLPPCLIGYQLR